MLEYTSIKVAASDHAELAKALTALVDDGHHVEAIVGAGSDVVAFLSKQVVASSHTAPAAQAAPAAQPAPVAQPAPSPSPAPVAQPAPSPTPAPAAAAAPVQPAAVAQPAVPAQQSIPADWYKDPAGRYEYRYWDGSKWTTKVSRGGVMYDDPATP